MPDFGRDASQVAVGDAQSLGVRCVQPDRIALGDFVQPFGGAAASMDQRWQAERRQQAKLAGSSVDLPPIDVAFDVARQRIFGPAPID